MEHPPAVVSERATVLQSWALCGGVGILDALQHGNWWKPLSYHTKWCWNPNTKAPKAPATFPRLGFGEAKRKWSKYLEWLLKKSDFKLIWKHVNEESKKGSHCRTWTKERTQYGPPRCCFCSFCIPDLLTPRRGLGLRNLSWTSMLEAQSWSDCFFVDGEEE